VGGGEQGEEATMKRNNRYANWNGPGKPLTAEQLQQILAKEFGIEPVLLEGGKWGYRREQIEEAARLFLDRARSTP
jgi:hypothetical protein